MMTGGLPARYLSPAMGFHENRHHHRHENSHNQRRGEKEDDCNESSSRYHTLKPGSRIHKSSNKAQPSYSSIGSTPALPSPSSSLSSLQSASFPSSPSAVVTSSSLEVSLEGRGLTCNMMTVSSTTTANSKCSLHSSSSSHHRIKTRLPPLFLIPSVLLLIVSNQGLVRHVQGQQVWSDPHHAPAGFGQQYASFEELQRLTENPFENNTAVNVTVPLGDNAFLRCKVRNLGERSISWVRRRDWHILTSGKTTYTNDERFHVLHGDGSDEWTLQIKFVQKRDNGTYECQVSTGTGIVSYLVHLMVAVPEAFILGNGEYHVEQGSTINLVCVIEKSPKPPEYIFWYHNDRMINYRSSREVKVHNEPGSKTHSRLTIRDAQISDSGNYTCKTAHAEPASTLVYVSQGDQIAAIQKRKAAAAASSTSVTSFSTQTPPTLHFNGYVAVVLINLTLLVPFLAQVSSNSIFLHDHVLRQVH